ncbi:MAG: tRNA dihydrouridine synthase DusB [Candidatus Marinimicrobia bacterium]|nr:tRNA dihydrouridine synthase DusB [Candidatus Neomarinimicrobiota bacterium]MBL7109696.1 tRNA dihydrouridine synthase DusB [Candidatus Neomarinimicrobiota bacterium]
MNNNLKIGKLELDNPIFLAPMAGVTDHSYRVIAREMGAGVVYTEFVSSNGIIRENQKTFDLASFTDSERPIGIQVFGDDHVVVGESAKMLYDRLQPDIIDINFGCPVPKVTKRGAGSGALKDLDVMQEITSAVLDAVPEIPITVKMRSGIDKNSIVSTEAAIRLEKIGVSAITLHPRTMKQQYTGFADWSLIKEMKDSVQIPIIGNGDIQNADDAMRMFNETGCDAIMIARGSLGNPWIFRSIKNKLTGKTDTPPTLSDRIQMCRRHFELLKSHKYEKVCVNLTKKHLNWYLKGFAGASDWRKKFMVTKTIEDIDKLLKELFIEFSVK